MKVMNIPNSQKPITPTVFRQTSDDDYRVATIKDQNQGSYLFSTEGLTKREYFAGLAMQGLMSNPNYASIDIARESLAVADQLLKDLDK